MVWCIWLTGCDGISINGDFESVIYFLVTAYSHKGTQWNLGCSFPFGFDRSNELLTSCFSRCYFKCACSLLACNISTPHHRIVCISVCVCVQTFPTFTLIQSQRPWSNFSVTKIILQTDFLFKTKVGLSYFCENTVASLLLTQIPILIQRTTSLFICLSMLHYRK